MGSRSIKNSAYRVAEILTKRHGISRRIGGQPFRFPARWARYYDRDYESDTFIWLQHACKSGDVAVDVGAHIGLFTVAMAEQVGTSGRVYSFEPTPDSRGALGEVVRLNRCSPTVEIRAEAVGRESGWAEFHVTGDSISNANSLVSMDRATSKLTVPVISLDDLAHEIARPINCVKIDAEGAELDILHGALEVYDRWRPATHLAIHPPAVHRTGATLEQLWNVLIGLDMSVSRNGVVVDGDWFRSQEALFDIVLLPRKQFVGE